MENGKIFQIQDRNEHLRELYSADDEYAFKGNSHLDVISGKFKAQLTRIAGLNPSIASTIMELGVYMDMARSIHENANGMYLEERKCAAELIGKLNKELGAVVGVDLTSRQENQHPDALPRV